ncbi:MAG: ribbon-helix-helix domain-containing protein [Acidobacteriaceae bacterium]
MLLGEKERRDLERLARKEKVSSGEIIRRSLGAYASMESRIRKEQEQELMMTALVMLSGAFTAANEAIEKTCNRLDRLHLELKKRDIR